jgi:ADP-ribose pyrophosphatase YjhB (NUDIX family)
LARFRYCPTCGTQTVPKHAEGRERDYCPRCPRLLYDNAKPCAGALVVDSAGRLLLGKRAISPFCGLWDIPGGFLEADEHPEAGAVREVFEETGLRVELTGLLGVWMDSYRPGDDPAGWHHSLNFYYTARPAHGAAVGGDALSPNNESSEIRWFSRDALPPMAEIAYENGRAALQAWLDAGDKV